MILYDAVATIDEVSKQFTKPKEVILIGSSTKYLNTNQFLDKIDGSLKKKLN